VPTEAVLSEPLNCLSVAVLCKCRQHSAFTGVLLQWSRRFACVPWLRLLFVLLLVVCQFVSCLLRQNEWAGSSGGLHTPPACSLHGPRHKGPVAASVAPQPFVEWCFFCWRFFAGRTAARCEPVLSTNASSMLSEQRVPLLPLGRECAWNALELLSMQKSCTRGHQGFCCRGLNTCVFPRCLSQHAALSLPE
jgi:hypothetical protein